MDVEQAWDFRKSNGAILSIAHPNFTFKWGIEEFEKVLPDYVEKWVNAVEINSKATSEWIDAIFKAKSRFNLLLTMWSDNHGIGRVDDKHTDLWSLNPRITNIEQREILREYLNYF
jgi:hypothetical protein